MKKTFLAVAFAMVAMVSSAQVYVGGSLGFSSQKAKNAEYGTTNFSFAPEVGYVLSENFAIGLPIGIDFEKTAAQKFLNAEGTTKWSVAPYARYTFLSSGALSLFVDGVLGFNGEQGGDANISVYVAPGVALSVSENFSLVSRLGSLGWSNLSGNGNYFGLNADASIASVGVYYTF